MPNPPASLPPADFPAGDLPRPRRGKSGGFDPVGGSSENFGPYQLIRKIAESGVGELFQATHSQTKESGVLKRLRADRIGSILSQRRFEFEMELGKSLRHPNLVMIRDSGIIDSRHYLFMDEIKGPSLRRILQGNAPWQVTTEVLLQCLEQIAHGIAFVHRAGIVHCDLKPENILFHAPNRPVLIDFGLAYRRGGPNPSKGQDDTRTTGYIMGTPMYMPPETITGQIVNVTPGADVYSFGVMLFEVLAGRPPFELEVLGGNKQTNLMHLIEQVVDQAPPTIRSIRPEVALAWDELCQRCLEKKPGNRPDSMDEVGRDVGSILRTGKPATLPPKGVMKRITRWFK